MSYAATSASPGKARLVPSLLLTQQLPERIFPRELWCDGIASLVTAADKHALPARRFLLGLALRRLPAPRRVSEALTSGPSRLLAWPACSPSRIRSRYCFLTM